MCSYIGTDDPSRDHQVDLHFEDLLDVVPSYSKVKLVAEDEGLLPFTASNQAPAVSRPSSHALIFIPLIMFADEISSLTCRSTGSTKDCLRFQSTPLKRSPMLKARL